MDSLAVAAWSKPSSTDTLNDRPGDPSTSPPIDMKVLPPSIVMST
jgi:hypothetical protein